MTPERGIISTIKIRKKGGSFHFEAVPLKDLWREWGNMSMIKKKYLLFSLYGDINHLYSVTGKKTRIIID